MKNIHVHILLTILLITVLNSCNSFDDDTYNPDLVFENSYEIEIQPYSYTDKQTNALYFIKGDTILDTLSGSPVFIWENNHSSIATCAIFSKPILVENGEIGNPHDIIWQWHTKMESESVFIESTDYIKVSYDWGCPVLDKNIQYNTQPLAMQSGLYFWAVWSWDKNGKKVLYSTKAMKFIVE